MRAPERPGPVRGLVAATSFLTRLPLGPLAGRVSEADLTAGVAWFPVIGGAVGLLGVTAGWLLALRTPTALAAVVTVAVETVVTGAFHLDGLADTADGIGAATTGRDGLRVMREPTVGAFGVVAVALDLSLRIAATGAVLSDGGLPWAVVAAAAGARFAPLLLARSIAYLRPETGSGSWVGDGPRTVPLALAGSTALLLCAPLGPAGAAAVLGGVLAATLAVGATARRLFGGATGDVFGASAELAQTVALTAVVAATGR